MSIFGFAASVQKSWKRYSTYRRAIRQLESLDDRQLADIGVSRSGIEDMARGARR